MALIFYVNALEGRKAYYQATRYIHNYFINKYAIPYGIPYKIVPLDEDIMNKEFLLNVLIKQQESKGIDVIAKKGMFDLSSKVFKTLADRGVNKAAIREWKAMVINNRMDSTLLSVNGVIDYLLNHPYFIRSYFVYDDGIDTYATYKASELCDMAVRRHTYEIRKNMRKEEFMRLCLSIDDTESEEAWEMENIRS